MQLFYYQNQIDSYGEKIMEFPLIYGNPAKKTPDS